nr:hypothetical protein [Tanacetum cinerariifolium]
MFFINFTSQIPPEKSRGRGSQGKKTLDTHVADVNVSEESSLEPTKKKTASRRVVKKKVTIFADDNIIPDIDVALELGKSISSTEAEEEEALRQVHATLARMVTESVPKLAKKQTGSQSTRGVVVQDTPSAPKPKPEASKLKLKGKKKIILEWRSKQASKYSEEDQDDDEQIDWIYTNEEDDKKKYDTYDDKSINLEITSDEETNDEVLQSKEQTNNDKDEEMTNDEVEDSGKGDAETSDVAKADEKKTEEAKDDAKKAKIPLTSFSLSVSSGFGD